MPWSEPENPMIQVKDAGSAGLYTCFFKEGRARPIA
jgi:hypothetical protein